jgi:predicted kinase
MEKKVNVYMMIGFPGAGKDTWIKNHLPNIPTVCRDEIRYELGFCGRDDKSVLPLNQERVVTGIFASRLVDYVKNGQDVIINNTNLKRQYRNGYKKLLEKYDVNWIYVVVEAPDLETNIERRKGQIPAEAFPRIKANYEPPTPDEYDEIIYDKQEKI